MYMQDSTYSQVNTIIQISNQLILLSHTVPQCWYEMVTEWMGLDSLPSIHIVIWGGSAALYLPSSGLIACGFMGPVRMGLAVETEALSESVRSHPAWWFGAEVSSGGFPPWSSRGALLTCGALSCCCCCCCCSEKNLWVDWSTSALCFACWGIWQNQAITQRSSHCLTGQRTGKEYAIRPLGPALLSGTPVCFWLQGRDQRVLVEDAGYAVGAGVWDEALDHLPHWVTLEGPWESAGHLRQMS